MFAMMTFRSGETIGVELLETHHKRLGDDGVRLTLFELLTPCALATPQTVQLELPNGAFAELELVHATPIDGEHVYALGVGLPRSARKMEFLEFSVTT